MRVQDTSGTYYWHVPTGTTQWEPPGGPHETPSDGSTPTEGPTVSGDWGWAGAGGGWGVGQGVGQGNGVLGWGLGLGESQDLKAGVGEESAVTPVWDVGDPRGLSGIGIEGGEVSGCSH
uniref:WW domain-containing protein n=1 Tax=Ficedula albicollis TaxID=59894 RepID=A0A803W086_FICAL